MWEIDISKQDEIVRSLVKIIMADMIQKFAVTWIFQIVD